MPTAFGSGSAPVTITTSPNAGATKADTDHKLFSAQGFHWLFFLKKNVEYTTSRDGTNWSNPTVISSACGDGDNFDVYYDPPSGEIYFVQALCGARTFTYGVAKPSAGGTLVWATPLTVVQVPQATGTYGVSRPTVRPDSLGDIFVAFEGSVAEAASISIHLMVYEEKSGSWSLVFDHDTKQSGTDWMGSIQEFTSGKMSLYYGTVNGGWTGYLQDWSGSAWGPPIVFPGKSRLEPMNGAGLTLGDTLYWAGFNYDDDGIVGFFSHAYGNATPPSITNLQSAASLIKDGEGCIGSNGNSTLVAVYASAYGYGPANAIFYRVSNDLGKTWRPEQTLTSGEAGIQGKTLQCSSISSSGSVQIAWTSGVLAPYLVRSMNISDVEKQAVTTTTSATTSSASATAGSSVTTTSSSAESAPTSSTTRSTGTGTGVPTVVTTTNSSSGQTSPGNGGGIPEFPFDMLAAVVLPLLTVAWYLWVRRSSPGLARSVLRPDPLRQLGRCVRA